MSKQPFCGIDPVPKNKKRGTLEQCTRMKQIRYYGQTKANLEKVNEVRELADLDGAIKKLNILINSKMTKRKSLSAEIDHLKKKLKKAKEEDKSVIKSELETKQEDFDVITDIIKDFMKKRDKIKKSKENNKEITKAQLKKLLK